MTEYRFLRPQSVESLWVVLVNAPRLSTMTSMAREEMAVTHGAQLVLVPMLPVAGGYSGRFFFATCAAAEFFVSRVSGLAGLGNIGSITLLETWTANDP